MDYPAYVTTMASLMAYQPTDANFLSMLPNAIQFAELQLCRDIDFLGFVNTDSTTVLVQGVNAVNIPANVITLKNVNVINAAGARTPLTPVARAWLDNVWGSPAPSDTSIQGTPLYFAMVTQNSIIIGPSPDGPYKLEVISTIRPVTMSAGNPTTFIGTQFPDLFTASSMIYAAGWMKNYGSGSDNPQMALSWDARYKELLASADIEEARKKFQSQAWSSQQPTAAQPAQG